MRIDETLSHVDPKPLGLKKSARISLAFFVAANLPAIPINLRFLVGNTGIKICTDYIGFMYSLVPYQERVSKSP